jgi:hypothetical protein
MGPKNWEAIGLPAYGTNHVLFYLLASRSDKQ